MAKESLQALIERYLPSTIEIREHLHRHPELGNQEFASSELIQKTLKEAGIECYQVPDMTGVVGLIRGGQKGKTVALRADIDALSIKEDSSKPYCSVNEGVMHACGHDAHTAILLGAAKVLQEKRASLKGNVKLLFQPAEETTGGAQRMIAKGCLTNPKVDYVFGLHMDSSIPTGKVTSKPGPLNASCDSFKVTIHGQKAHGASPHLGKDALVAAASIVLALQTIVSRRVSPQEPVVITIGKMQAGTAENVIADRADLAMTVRTLAKEVRQFVNETIEDIINHTCSMHGVKAEIKKVPGYDVLINDEDCVELVREVAQSLLGEESFAYLKEPSLGCEDFGYFCQDIPGAFYQLGCRNEELGITAEIHSSQFDVDPASLGLGIKMQVGLVLKLIGSGDN